jgi:hypothetical protein
LNNLDVNLENNEEKVLSIINTTDNIGNNIEKDFEERVNQLDEIISDNKSESSSVSRQDVLDMIKENNKSFR